MKRVFPFFASFSFRRVLRRAACEMSAFEGVVLTAWVAGAIKSVRLVDHRTAVALAPVVRSLPIG